MSDTNKAKGWITAKLAAERTGLSYGYVRTVAWAGKIPGTRKVGKERLIPLEWVLDREGARTEEND